MGSVLAFVEVKSSRSLRHAEPARQVKYQKFLNLSKAAYRMQMEEKRFNGLPTLGGFLETGQPWSRIA